jgi:hypothetical protein
MKTDGRNKLRFEVVDREMAEVLRKKTEAERLQIAWGMWRSARQMLTRLISNEHPDLSEDQINQLVSRRMSGGNS